MAEEAGEIELEDEGEERDPEAEARRRFALAQIRQYPDPALRLPARELADVDDDVRRLAERMMQLMHDAHGVGLAATQVGVLRRMFVFRAHEEEARAVVNPRLVELSDEQETEDEGCLSLQGVLVPVERSVSLRLEGLDLQGEEISLELEGLAARVAQHEADHLDGVLIVDRTDREHRRDAMRILRPQPILVPR